MWERETFLKKVSLSPIPPHLSKNMGMGDRLVLRYGDGGGVQRKSLLILSFACAKIN